MYVSLTDACQSLHPRHHFKVPVQVDQEYKFLLSSKNRLLFISSCFQLGLHLVRLEAPITSGVIVEIKGKGSLTNQYPDVIAMPSHQTLARSKDSNFLQCSDVHIRSNSEYRVSIQTPDVTSFVPRIDCQKKQLRTRAYS
jgi:hypothetical protein